VAAEKRSSIKDLRRRIYDLRAAGNSWDVVADTFGMREHTARAHYARAIAVDGLPEIEIRTTNAAVEMQEPEKAAAALLTASNPLFDKYEALREAARESGMKPALVKAMIKRLETRYAPVADEVKRLNMKAVVDELDKKIAMTMGYIDDHSLSEASFRDLAQGIGVLIEKRQLLSGLPTQNLDITARMQINEALPILLNEAKRRGITLDVTPTAVTYEKSMEVPVVVPAMQEAQPVGEQI